MTTQQPEDRWQEDRTYTEFFHEGHIPVSRGLDDEFRDWLADHIGGEIDQVNDLRVTWSWGRAENDGRPVTVATVNW